jgi:hypothetical protein
MCHQDNPDLQLWLREANILQKAARSTSLARSLPVLRRLIKSKVLVGITLPELTKNAGIVQRKHLLNMLALENGQESWLEFKKLVQTSPRGTLKPYSVELRNAGYPILWFSTDKEAKAYAAQNGGRVVKVEQQAAVIPERMESGISS